MRAGAGWLDGFLTWPVSGADTDCTVADPDLDMDRLLSTAGSSPATAVQEADRPDTQPTASRALAGIAIEASTQSSEGSAGQYFCIHHGAVPVFLKPGSRPANVAGHQLSAPEDMVG